MFPNLKQERVEQALESAGSGLGKAINILLEENYTGVFCLLLISRVNNVRIHQMNKTVCLENGKNA